MRTSWCSAFRVIVTKTNEDGRVFSERIIATLRFSTAGKIWEMTAFYHMASEIKPGRGLTTKLTRTFRGDLVVYERRRSQLFGSNNLPRDLCQHVFAHCCCCFQRFKYRRLL